MYKSNPVDWLNAIFHFSFAEYRNPDNVNFGPLRVLNDDLIGHGGFNTHPHKDMEILTYVVDGNLTHKDSLGNEGTLGRGEVQYMSAGTGIYHSEMNETQEIVRSLQIWILPNAESLEPVYGDYRFKWEERVDKLLHIASGKDGTAPVKINQDVNIYAICLSEGGILDFPLPPGRQCYVVQVEGTSDINGQDMQEKDALEAVETDLKITASTKAHILFLEMGKDII